MATMTITTTAGDAQRLATAMGAKLGLNTAGVARDASAAEIKSAVIDYMRGVVADYDRQVAAQAAANAATQIAPT